MNGNSVDIHQSAIEQLLVAINSLLIAPIDTGEDVNESTNSVTTPTCSQSALVESCVSAGACNEVSLKGGILPIPYWNEAASPLSSFSAPRVQQKYASTVPFWEQQAPFNTMTLPDVFSLLESEEEDCIVCVKKIHKLGFRSVKYLRQYFSQFGVISKIAILPSRQKDPSSSSYYGGSSGHYGTVRPASMGFLVMSNRWSANRIMMQDLHCVGEWSVEVSRFNKHASASPLRTPSVSSIETTCTQSTMHL